MHELKTKRSILRAFQKSDFGSLLEMMSDADVMRHTGFKKPQSGERVSELLQKWIVDGQNSAGVWAAENLMTGDFIGWFMLKQTEFNDPEIGFMLPKGTWGQGYATEVSWAVLTYAFSELKVGRVIATVNQANFPSINVLKKIGMNPVTTEFLPEHILCFEKFNN